MCVVFYYILCGKAEKKYTLLNLEAFFHPVLCLCFNLVTILYSFKSHDRAFLASTFVQAVSHIYIFRTQDPGFFLKDLLSLLDGHF